MATNTTIVFVPGAWHGPEGFEEVASRLRKAGYQTEYVHLPSVGPKEHLTDLKPDIAAIRTKITQAVDKGHKVVLVMHSYGSLPSQEAVLGLEYKTRQAANQPGGVTHLFFMASFIIPLGATLVGAFGGNPLPWFDVSADQLEVNPTGPAEIFYNDMSDDLVKKWVSQLKPFSYRTMNTPVMAASWQTIPSTYLYCLKDAAIPITIQEMMVKEIAKGFEIRSETVDASHSPFHSKPDETAAAIQRAAELSV